MRRLLGGIAIGSALACSDRTPGPPAPAVPPPEERGLIEGAVVDSLFGAISRFDYDGLRRSVTPEFELVEDTLRMTVEDLIGLVRRFEGHGTMQYRFSDLNTRVAGDVAWTTYRNDGAAVFTGRAPEKMAWLETAVLVRRDGTWRVERLQSNPVTALP